MKTDALGFDLPHGLPGYVRLAGGTLLLDQLIALPVALAMTSVGLPFRVSILIASIYSHSIGGVCTTLSVALFPILDRLPPRRGLACVVALYFVCGATGAELARRVCGLIYGPGFNAGPPTVSWAIGATMALLVGVALRTMRGLRRQVLATELEALQARINPHFLFNTLNSIAALIREDPARAEAMTLQLSSLFRYTLTAPRRGLVTIEEELTIVEGYLAIEQERLGSRLTYEIDIDAGVSGYRVPALTLQPLVENAIKHGIASEVGGGSVRVRGWQEGGQVHLSVTDTGRGASQSAGTGEGLESVRRRLRATFGAAGTIAFSPADGSSEARVTFPARELEA
jgi:two-component system sensor histidine kinase AlgZ